MVFFSEILKLFLFSLLLIACFNLNFCLPARNEGIAATTSGPVVTKGDFWDESEDLDEEWFGPSKTSSNRDDYEDYEDDEDYDGNGDDDDVTLEDDNNLVETGFLFIPPRKEETKGDDDSQIKMRHTGRSSNIKSNSISEEEDTSEDRPDEFTMDDEDESQKTDDEDDDDEDLFEDPEEDAAEIIYGDHVFLY